MNKVALITGASRGIGAATTKLLAKHGYKVCINYLSNKEKAEAIVKEIGNNAIALKADIGKEEDIISMFNEIEKKLGKITALVNNTGINEKVGSGKIEEITLDAIERTMAVNFTGTVLCCREAIGHMKKTGGAIVNVTSQAAKFGGNNMAIYAASKAAVEAMAIGLAREVASYNIRVNCVSPAIIDTDAHKDITEERKSYIKQSLPMGRMGTPEETAEAIAWLLSDKASYISGVVLPVTGAR